MISVKHGIKSRKKKNNFFVSFSIFREISRIGTVCGSSFIIDQTWGHNTDAKSCTVLPRYSVFFHFPQMIKLLFNTTPTNRFKKIPNQIEQNGPLRTILPLSHWMRYSQSYQTFFFVKWRFFPFFCCLACVLVAKDNIACTLKWPSLKAKIWQTKKSKFGRIDS
jgi:hypothetical protein